MIIVWIISLIFHWENFSFIQLFGYLLLTYGIYKFNQVENGEKVKHSNEEEEPMRSDKVTED